MFCDARSRPSFLELSAALLKVGDLFYQIRRPRLSFRPTIILELASHPALEAVGSEVDKSSPEQKRIVVNSL